MPPCRCAIVGEYASGGLRTELEGEQRGDSDDDSGLDTNMAAVAAAGRSGD